VILLLTGNWTQFGGNRRATAASVVIWPGDNNPSNYRPGSGSVVGYAGIYFRPDTAFAQRDAHCMKALKKSSLSASMVREQHMP